MDSGQNCSGKASAKLILAAALGYLLIAGHSAAANNPPVNTAKQASEGSVTNQLRGAQAAVKSGNYRLALIHLRNAVQIAPSNSEARIQLGLLLFQTGDQAGGERELRRAWKSGAPEKTVLPILYEIMLVQHEEQELLDQFPDPGSANSPTAPDLLRTRALALQNLGRPAEALDAIDRAVKLRRDWRALLVKARISLQQGNLNAARQFSDESQKLSPNSLETAIFRLSVLQSAKDRTGALAFADQLLAKFPNSIEVKLAHIEVLLDQRQDAKAKAEVDALLAQKPGASMAIYYKALLLSRAGNSKGAWDVAMALQKEALEISPLFALKVAQLAVDAGRDEAAAKILGRILGRDPGNQTARLKLAELYMAQNNAMSALNALGPMKDSSDPKTLALLASIYKQLDRNTDATAVQEKLKAATSGNPLELRRAALANIQAGRPDQAIKDLSEAVAKNPTNPVLVAPMIGALMQTQRYTEALRIADRLGGDPKQRAASMVFRGDILAQKRDLADAETAFNEAIKLEPDSRNALLGRAGLYLLIQRYDQATRDLHAILAGNPKDAAALTQLAYISARQGRDGDVRSNLAKAIAADPADPDPRLSLSRYLAERGQLRAAQEQADSVAKLQPSNAEAVELQGTIHQRMGQKKEAAASFRRLALLLPNSVNSQLSLANALFMAGDRAGSLKAMDAALALAPKSHAVKAAQIDQLLAMGQAEQAVSAARAFRKANPQAESDILLADALERTKHADEAMDILSNSFSTKPTRAVLIRYVRLATMQKQDKRGDNALASWLQKYPGDVGTRLEFANFYLNQGDTARAATLYEAVLQRQPGNILAMNNLGDLLRTSNPRRASALLTKAVELAPNLPEVNDSLGWLKVQQKDAASGLTYLKRAHDLRPKDATITYHLVVALDANAKRNDARPLLKNLLASGEAFPDKQAALNLAAQWR